MSLPEINKEIASTISEYENMTFPKKDSHIPINISGIPNGIHPNYLRTLHFDEAKLEKFVCIDNITEPDLELNKIYL